MSRVLKALSAGWFRMSRFIEDHKKHITDHKDHNKIAFVFVLFVIYFVPFVATQALA